MLGDAEAALEELFDASPGRDDKARFGEDGLQRPADASMRGWSREAKHRTSPSNEC